MPLIQDELAHFFWKAKHLATVHHQYGDHHAMEEMVDAEHDDHDAQPTILKSFEPVSVHVAIDLDYKISKPTIPRQQFALDVCNFSTLSLDKHYPPPKLC